MLNSYCEQLFNSVSILLLISACLSTVSMVTPLALSLAGIVGRILLNSLPTFGIKFGVSVVVLPLESCFRLKRPAREGLNMKFVVYAIVSATSDETHFVTYFGSNS